MCCLQSLEYLVAHAKAHAPQNLLALQVRAELKVLQSRKFVVVMIVIGMTCLTLLLLSLVRCPGHTALLMMHANRSATTCLTVAARLQEAQARTSQQSGGKR
jgi:hypothetical protein